ncbi:receptor like protein kinase S.2-like [Durio zibethinus]|uniref:Receptor like protein kinase S.2-like n=1 Tax=Durio zibethinus TaxID=66656 RepID=A0A6P5X479_DURZI|nr:receptor like protein kinase S.2-like [Durio zibethinus]
MGTALLNWEHRRKIVGGLEAALFYLHEQLETRIIHRDVKTSNVMLDSQYNARLGDFGLARIGGTIGYLPPESFPKRSVATAKFDVFGFGIVVLKAVSGRLAVDLIFPDKQIILLDWIRRLSDEGTLLHARVHCERVARESPDYYGIDQPDRTKPSTTDVNVGDTTP